MDMDEGYIRFEFEGSDSRLRSILPSQCSIRAAQDPFGTERIDFGGFLIAATLG
jgi:hypothetical protein